MSTTKSWIRPVVVVAAIGILAAGCGSKKAAAPATTAAAAVTTAKAGAAPAAGEKIVVGLITKNATNPFFIKMTEGAKAEAAAKGVEMQTFAGTKDGDNETQVAAVETLIAAKAKGVLITPNDSKAIAPVLAKAKAAGLLTIALDTVPEPANIVDITFATDNYLAGQLIGKWAKAKLGDKAASAKIALLDLNADQISVDVSRDQGFLNGFGIDTVDPKKMGDEKDPRIVGNDVTSGSIEGGQKAMENLLVKNPGINVVYTINEPAAEGAYKALKAAGKEAGVLIVSVDGGCHGVDQVAKKVIGATSMQFPLKMASLGVDAIIELAKTGKKPANSPGLEFFNTGVNLITDEPMAGIESLKAADGAKICWGTI